MTEQNNNRDQGRKHVSDQPFDGSERYLYYKDKKPYLIYSDHDISKADKKPFIIATVILAVVIIPCLIGLIASVKIPSKVRGADKKGGFVIEDGIGVLEDEKLLKSSMKDFYEKTGIMPAVITVDNDAWIRNYKDLQYFAYDIYVNRFEDEAHWLIVYSDDGNGDWYWDGIKGDKTDKILTDNRSHEFTEALQDRLEDEDISVDEAIASTLDDYKTVFMKPSVNTGLFLFCLIMTLATAGAYVIVIVKTRSNVPEEYKNAKLIKKDMVYQDVCNFCGGIYIIGVENSCPHCGAAIPAHHYIKDDQGNVIDVLN